MLIPSYTRTVKKVTVLVWVIYLLSIFLLNISTSLATEKYYSYLGGNLSDTAYAITTDALNNIYITGQTNSDNFNGFETPSGKTQFNQNCFVSRINLENPNQNYYFEFAGTKRETCRAIAVDSAFNVYVTGETESSDLPMTTTQAYGGGWDAFIFKLSPLGELIYASYIGGSLTDYGHGLALRGPDDVFITGETWSNDFPTTSNAYSNSCLTNNSCEAQLANAFVTHIDTSNSSQFISEYSSYLGGENQDKAHSIAIDFSGILHIAGETNSTDFPLKNEISNRLKGKLDGFISLIDPSLNLQQSLIFSSYIGGNADEYITAITTDIYGNSYFTGSSSSDDFPTTQTAFSQRCANGVLNCLNAVENDQHTDIFITQIKNNQITYSTLLGGTKSEVAHAITVNSFGEIYVSGTTHSADFPLTNNALDNFCNDTASCIDNSDGFILKIDPEINNKNGLLFSSYTGGDQNDDAVSVTLVRERIFLTGSTLSPNLATTSAINKTQQNTDAYLQEIEIDGIGKWIDNTPSPTKSKSSASSLNAFYLLFLILLGIILRRTR